MSESKSEGASKDEGEPQHTTARQRIDDLRVRGLDIKDQATDELDDAVRRFWPVALLVETVKRWLSAVTGRRG